MAFCEHSFTTAGELTAWLLAADGLCSLGVDYVTLWRNSSGIRLEMWLQLCLYYVLADSLSCPVDEEATLKVPLLSEILCSHAHVQTRTNIYTYINTDVRKHAHTYRHT